MLHENNMLKLNRQNCSYNINIDWEISHTWTFVYYIINTYSFLVFETFWSRDWMKLLNSSNPLVRLKFKFVRCKNSFSNFLWWSVSVAEIKTQSNLAFIIYLQDNPTVYVTLWLVAKQVLEAVWFNDPIYQNQVLTTEYSAAVYWERFPQFFLLVC